METLDTLRKFTEKYPQKIEEQLEYSFLGGTAIRLLQEAIGSKEKRPISDFDLLIFKSQGLYPVHNCYTKDVFGVISSNPAELSDYVTSVVIKGKGYFSMNGTFLTLTKTCAMDNPREKDYHDVQFLNSENLIDFNELDSLYNRANRLTNVPQIPIKVLKFILEHKNSKLFQTFPRLANLISEFDNTEKVTEMLSDYSKKDLEKDGYALASVIYDTHSLIRELSDLSEQEKLEGLEKILEFARKNDYVDFDRIVHSDLIPRFRYSPTQQKEILESLNH